jgi:hypothetical protein
VGDRIEAYTTMNNLVLSICYFYTSTRGTGLGMKVSPLTNKEDISLPQLSGKCSVGMEREER